VAGAARQEIDGALLVATPRFARPGLEAGAASSFAIRPATENG